MNQSRDQFPSIANVLVTLLLLVACGAMAAVFMIPNASPWFWPTVGIGVGSGVLAMLVPLKRRPS